MRGALFALIATGCIPRLYTQNGQAPSDWAPPENTWTLSTPPAELEGEGYQDGDVIPDFLLRDQHGDDVSLWQFYGNVVLLDVSTIWCRPCQLLAEGTEETWQDYRDEGFVYVTVLQQDLDGNPPDAEDLLFWADSFGITSPVLDDGDLTGVGGAMEGDAPFPQVLVIGRDMKIRERIEPPDDEHVREAIEDVLR